MPADPRAIILPTALRQRLARLDIVSRRQHENLQVGSRRSRRKGTSIEFVDYRPYSSGDDYRHIDWNIFGRSDNLFVKLREAEELLAVHFLIDCSASMDHGKASKLDYAANLAAALSYVALSSGDNVSAAFFSTQIQDQDGLFSGFKDVPRMLAFFDRVRSGGGTSLIDPFRQYAARQIPTGVIFLVSDLLSPKSHRGLGLLSQRGYETIVLHLLDKDILTPNIPEDAELVDCESGEKLILNGADAPLRLYRANLHNWLKRIAAFCARIQVRYAPVETDWPIEDVVLHRLRANGVLS